MDSFFSVGLKQLSHWFLALGLFIGAFFPQSVLAATKVATIQGKVQVRIVEHVGNSSSADSRQVFIRDSKSGKVFELNSSWTLPNTLRSGDTFTIKGRLNTRSKVLAPLSQQRKARELTVTGPRKAPPSRAAVSGTRNVLVLIGDFQDAKVECSPEQVTERVFGSQETSVASIIRRSSFGNLNITGEVRGPYPLEYGRTNPATGSTGFMADTAAALKAAAEAEGLDLKQFQHFVYVVPGISGCDWSGIAELGGKQVWTQGSCGSSFNYYHELGHNFGMEHSRDYDFQTSKYSEYGDHSDFMGHGAFGLNPQHLLAMSWLPDGSNQSVTAAGHYTLASLYAGQTNAPRMLTVQLPELNGWSYFLSYRARAAGEPSLEDDYDRRVEIHVGSPGTGQTTLLGLVGPHETFVHPSTGFTVTNSSDLDESAEIDVSTTCTVLPPKVELYNRNGTSEVGVGKSLLYYAIITNQNTISCPTKNYNLQVNVPDGVTFTLDTSEVPLPSQNGINIPLKLTVSQSMPNGSFTFTVQAKDAQDTQSQGLAYGPIYVSGGGAVTLSPYLSQIKSAAMSSYNAVSPGMNFSLLGANLLSPGASACNFSQTPVMGELCGTQVLLNGSVPVPLFSVKNNQIDGQIPYEATDALRFIEVRTSAGTFYMGLSVFDSLPGIYTRDGSGSGAGSVSHLDWNPVSTTAPARIGETVFFWGTGLGRTTPAAPTGVPSALGGDQKFEHASFIAIYLKDGGSRAYLTPLWSGKPDGTIGIDQVNFTLPDSLKDYGSAALLGAKLAVCQSYVAKGQSRDVCSNAIDFPIQ